MTPVRLTTAQALLLEELVLEGGLYIRRNSRPHGSVVVLGRLGYAEITEPDHSSFRQDRWEPTYAGIERAGQL